MFNYILSNEKWTKRREKHRDRNWERVNWIFPFKLKIEFYASLFSFHECMLHVFSVANISATRGGEREKNNKSVCSLTVKLSGKTKSINIFVYKGRVYAVHQQQQQLYHRKHNIQKYSGWVVGEGSDGKIFIRFFHSRLFHSFNKNKMSYLWIELCTAEKRKIKIMGKWRISFYTAQRREREKNMK